LGSTQEGKGERERGREREREREREKGRKGNLRKRAERRSDESPSN